MRGRAVLGATLLGAAVFAAASGAAGGGSGVSLTNVPSPEPKAGGYAPASILRELRQTAVAQGSLSLENPSGIIGWYGYENDAPSPDDPSLPQMVPAAGSTTEAQKTEPDKNTYLVLTGEHGADPSYDYGTHFVFQGHEAGVDDQSLITRINLDADLAHRVTLMATKDTDGNPIAPIDGSTWDPFAQKLIFTTENVNAPTYSATPDYPSTVEDLSGSLGRGGFEGVQVDPAGDVWIVEDIGGSVKPGSVNAKRPNSYVYRFVPDSPGDLTSGKLQVLQVFKARGKPITFESEGTFPSEDQIALHTFGKRFNTRWLTIHDTSTDGTEPFNANALAKAQDEGTPFKRPENGNFRPGGFKDFYFDETGDTNATSSENGNPTDGLDGAGGWGSIFRLSQTSPSADDGNLTIFFKGNEAVTGLDNMTFISRDQMTFVEDAGDTLHTQRKALDSGYVFDVTRDYSGGAQPIRWLAEGRDPSATLDSGNGGFGTNEGDNEITGVFVSNGDPTVEGLLGTKAPNVGHHDWRWFYTQQHGDNFTWEVLPTG
jgi:hypothetical protein